MYMLLNVQVLNGGNLCCGIVDRVHFRIAMRTVSRTLWGRTMRHISPRHLSRSKAAYLAQRPGWPPGDLTETRHGAQHLSLRDPFPACGELEVWSIGQGGEQRRSTTVTGGIVAAIPGSTRTSRSWAGRGSRSGNNLHGGSSWAMIEGCWILFWFYGSCWFMSLEFPRNLLKSAYIMLNVAGSPAKLAYV